MEAGAERKQASEDLHSPTGEQRRGRDEQNGNKRARTCTHVLESRGEGRAEQTRASKGRHSRTGEQRRGRDEQNGNKRARTCTHQLESRGEGGMSRTETSERGPALTNWRAEEREG